MKLALIRSGGVAGMPRRCVVRTKPGSAEEKKFRALVSGADLARFPEPTIRTGPDRLRYTLIVEDGETRHSILFDEQSTPEQFRPLIEAILQHGDTADPDATRG